VKEIRSSPLDTALWAASFVVLALIVGGSLSAQTEPPLGVTDKLAHFAAYVALTFLFLLAAVWSPLRGLGRFPRSTVLVLLGAIALGAAIELGQGLVPGRHPDLNDALADTLGTGVGLAAWQSLRTALAE
jgi:VanZ family protein